MERYPLNPIYLLEFGGQSQFYGFLFRSLQFVTNLLLCNQHKKILREQ
ncbi:hypothetical protein BN2497_4797 [Janthinobacterium sp. CG23_2]|nr:hypothetical protein BN2497_4797 [Janthinobacterium sp. CG23_2]CUU28796.1 hypothetical protein BN3177_4797 [Janthinobacterium sp. CG23_2]